MKRMAGLLVMTKLAKMILYRFKKTDFARFKNIAPLGLFVHTPRGVHILFLYKRSES